MIRIFAAAAIAAAVSGCAVLTKLDEVFDAGAAKLTATCETLDGEEVTVAIDNAAVSYGVEDQKDKLREARKERCNQLGLAVVLKEAVTAGVNAAIEDPEGDPVEP